MTRYALTTRRAVVVAVAVVAVLAAGVGTYAWATAGPRIDPEQSAGMNGATIVRGEATVTTYAADLCLDDEGSVEIVDVDFARPLDGLEVTDFALVEPVPMKGGGTMHGDTHAEKPLRESTAGHRLSTTLPTRCGDGADSLFIELRKPAGRVRARGLDITYVSAGREHTVRADFDVTYCEPRKRGAFCRAR